MWLAGVSTMCKIGCGLLGQSTADGRAVPASSRPCAPDRLLCRRLYEEVGLGWVYALTKVPAVESLANK